MKRFLYLVLALLTTVITFAQNNYNMVIELDNGTRVSYDCDRIKEYLFVEKPKAEEFTINGVSFKLIKVEGGTFKMGSDDGKDNEKPVHNVTLSDFYIGETEVTQAQWEAVMGGQTTAGSSWKDSSGKGDDYPAYFITWDECQQFLSKLYQLTRKRYRLPTEAEWEYAARGGNMSQGYNYSGSNDIEKVAWYHYNCLYGSPDYGCHPVGTKTPNELSLYDMSGNLYEWVSDFGGKYSSDDLTNPTGPTTGSSHVCRGGNWNYPASDCRVSSRAYFSPESVNGNIGFRLAFSQ